MAGSKTSDVMKKNPLSILLFPVLAVFGLAACAEDEIKTYAPGDSAVIFHARSNSFSLKGLTEPYKDVTIPVDLVGYTADYDRPFSLEADDSTAVLGRDYTITSAVMPAGAVSSFIHLRINRLPDGVEERAMRLRIVPNEYFRAGIPKDSRSEIKWSEAYVRPDAYVWRAWYLFLSHGYSKDYHRLLVEFFGEEIETYVNTMAASRDNPALTYKLMTWWYQASRDFRDFVRRHDEANPGAPVSAFISLKMF